jgi:alkylation response protein AidB-like acyl-CoA dehydrogenase
MILTPEQQAIKQETKEFTAKYIIPYADEYDQKAEFPSYILEPAKKANLVTQAIPKEYGGLGYDAKTQALIGEELAYGCAGIATCLGASGLGTYPALLFGTEEQKRYFIAPLLEGKFAAFGLTEAAAGSDAGADKSVAVRVGDEYIINGSKSWITNGGYANMYSIFALTDPTAGMKGLSCFMVPRPTPGFTVGTADHKMGIRASNTADLILKDVHVPVANRLGKEGQGMMIAMMTLDRGRPSIGTMACGIAQRLIDECVKYVHTRFTGKTRASQAMQFKLADMQVQLDVARTYLYYVMDLRDAGLPFSKESAICKTFSSDAVVNVVQVAMSLFGSYAYTDPLICKLMRDTKIMQIFEGTNQIQRLVVSRAVLAPAPVPGAAQKAGK